jgi:serine/threonine protein kinase/tetratricopeptide (TPR) repeat protein
MALSSSELAGPARPHSILDLASPARPQGSDSAWISAQIELMADAWSHGRQIRAEDLLEQKPGLSAENSIRLIYEEVCLRREAGQDVRTSEVTSRFPEWKEQLEFLLDCDRLLWPLARSAQLPEIGEQLGPFRLVSELGRGASGKTYLAVEPALADRLVVLKVSAEDQEEHLSLARLQHTHIIPLYSEQTIPDRGLRVLCMPYFGGTSLARILEALAEIPPDQRRGRHLLEAVEQAQQGRPGPPVSTEGPYRRYLEQASYVQAICWIVACMADALYEAHTHGLVHMDVKPSNVLIAGDGLPMLLDFHLARKPIKAGEPLTDRLGGTPNWMAPEQDEALTAVRLGQPIPRPVDGRADLYGLGLLLCEALGGPGAGAEGARGNSWRRRNPQVSVGLADIAQKCLARKPTDRYLDAVSLADDLRRHLNDLPLRGVVNRSLSERWHKWRRRQPGALARGTAWVFTLAALVVVAFLGHAFYLQRVREIETNLEDARELHRGHRFPEAIRVLTRGLKHAATIPATSQLTKALTSQLQLAMIGQKATELHRLADIVRFRYGILPASGEETLGLLRTIRDIWGERDLLLKPGEGSLDDQTQRTIRTDLLELAILWANLRVRLASGGEVVQARREALAMIEEAAAPCGPSPALNRQRRLFAAALGQPSASLEPDLPPASAWEHYGLGRHYLRLGQIEKAAEQFHLAVEAQPPDFWSNYYEGLCAYELGRFDDAAAAFRTCIALAPTIAECYYNRAQAAEALRHTRQAFDDYTRALELNPALAEAALNRGILSYKEGRHDDAIADFQRALEASAGSGKTGRIHYNLALAFLAKGDRASARKSADAAAACGYVQVSTLRQRLGHEP